MGAGARGWSGSTGVPITFKTGSGSPVCSLRLGDDGGGCGMESMRAGSDPRLDFAFKLLQSRGGPEFTPVNGPGMPGFKPDVAGCNFVFLRFEVLAGGWLSLRTSRVLPLGDGGGGFGKLVCDTFPTMWVQLAVPISKWRRRREQGINRSIWPDTLNARALPPRPLASKTSSVICATVSTSAIIYRCSLAPTIHTRACLASIPPDAHVRCPLSGPHAGCNERVSSFRQSSSLLSESSIRPGRAEFRPGPILVYFFHIHWCFLSCANLFANMCSPSPYSSFHSTCAWFSSPLSEPPRISCFSGPIWRTRHIMGYSMLRSSPTSV
jgi:hypothetical protein